MPLTDFQVKNIVLARRIGMADVGGTMFLLATRGMNLDEIVAAGEQIAAAESATPMTIVRGEN